MILLTTSCKHRTDIRNYDFKYCAIKNINNTSIDKIIVFFENYKDSFPSLRAYNHLSDDRIEVVHTDSFPNFSVLFEYANEHCEGETVIIANADIYFDETLAKLNSVKLKDNMMLFLTRYIFDHGDIRLQNKGSFDSYIFRSPIKPFYGDIRQGISGCDSFLLQKAQEAGIRVFNPALSIKSYHHHFMGGDSGEGHSFKYWGQAEYGYYESSYCTVEDMNKKITEDNSEKITEDNSEDNSGE